jgi:hypothetical protein
MMIKKILIIILMLCFNLTLIDMGVWADTAGIQPRADVEQEKTEKKDEEKEKKLKRVWTDKDLKEIKKERVNITEVSPDPDKKKKDKSVSSPPALVKNTTEKKKFDPKKTEKYWRERKKALVDNIKRNEEEIERLEKKLLQLNIKRNGIEIHAQIVEVEQEIRDTYNKLQNYKKGLENLKKDLENLHDEARKAGALPGWLRD